jgi:1-deoxy-D-xylulose-5-phosphate reductoisomerase
MLRNPSNSPKTVALLGATGSIGASTLEVIRQHPDRFVLRAVAANQSVQALGKIARTHELAHICLFNERAASELQSELDRPVLTGMEGLLRIVSDPEIDIVVNALVGSVGCLPTLKAIEAGKHIALANKETMVMAGPLIGEALARSPQARITPVDSEHNAIFQCLAGRPESEVEELLITASGGPFRLWSAEQLAGATVADALNHPVWNMGKKITIDSASLMNKGLEVIEAHFLFGVPYEQIRVVVHPESMVHSLVQFRDGSLMAQLGAPDMKVPIQCALTWPERLNLETKRLDLAQIGALHFAAPDTQKFPCLRLAFEAGKAGGNRPAVLNAANEILANAFLDGKIGFLDIPRGIEKALSVVPEAQGGLTLDSVLEADRFAREVAQGFC